MIIVGRDGANLTDDVIDNRIPYLLNVSVSVGYYQRVHKNSLSEAMGLRVEAPPEQKQKKSNKRIVTSIYEQCSYKNGMEVCESVQERRTYAIPMEIIYTTPLASWNPYNLKYRGDAQSDAGQAVTADDRNRRLTADANTRVMPIHGEGQTVFKELQALF